MPGFVCMSQRTWNQSSDLLRAMAVVKYIKNGEIGDIAPMGKRLKKLGEVVVIDETKCFSFDFVKEAQGRFRSTTPNMGAVLQGRTDLRLIGF